MAWENDTEVFVPAREATLFITGCWICGHSTGQNEGRKRRKVCEACKREHSKEYIDQKLKARIDYIREQREARAMLIPPNEVRWIFGSPFRDPITKEYLVQS